MQIISTDSLEILRNEAFKNPGIISMDFQQVIENLGLDLISIKLAPKFNEQLVIPSGTIQELNFDAENCVKIFEILNDLTPAQATDERLWVTLCFMHYSDYIKARWPLDKAINKASHVSNHWFAKTNRNRIRDNAIARLWWMAKIASSVPGMSIDKVFRVLFFNSDYRSSLLERTSSTNAINVLASILIITQEHYASGHEYNRENFREFMRHVDIFGKRSCLASLDIDELVELLQPIYIRCYKLKSF